MGGASSFAPTHGHPLHNTRPFMEIVVSEIVLEDVVLHCGIQASSLDKEVTSAYFFDISRYLSEWKLIAPKVGLTDDEVAAIEEDNSKAERKRISFLEKWKQKFAMKATYRVLIESLLGIKRVEDARGVCQVLKGEQHDRPLDKPFN